jgi:hypothetical protein
VDKAGRGEGAGSARLCAGCCISREAAYPILGGLSNLGIVAPLVGRTIRRGGARVKLSVKPVGGKPHPDNCHIKAGLTVFFVVRLFRPTKTLPGEMR